MGYNSSKEYKKTDGYIFGQVPVPFSISEQKPKRPSCDNQV